MFRSVPQSLLFRLTALLSLMILGGLAILGFTAIQATNAHFVRMEKETLQTDASMVLNELSHQRMMAWRQPGLLEVVLLKHHVYGAIIQGDRLLASRGFSEDNLPGLQSDVSLLQVEGTRYRLLRVPLEGRVRNAQNATLVVAVDISQNEQFIAVFTKNLWLVLVWAGLIMMLACWFITRHTLSPLRNIISSANAISAKNLHVRIDKNAVPMDLHDLVDVLNSMLDKLEAAFEKLADFSANLAHELRTPISNMRVQTQVILSRERNREEYREALQSNIEELATLTAIIEQMLFLAKTESGIEQPHREPLDMHRELSVVVEYYEMLAETNDMHIELVGEGHCIGDKDMLRRAFGNVISNAVKYGTPGHAIHINIIQQTDTLSISIRNHGDTIPETEQDKIFTRFHRAAQAERAGTDGVGLGLAISQSIIQVHGGSMHLTSANGATTFWVMLPKGDVTGGC